MEIFQWNALRRGHEVTVHDPRDRSMSLLEATVAVVEVVPGRGRRNRLGLRVADPDGGTRIIWPTHLTAHLDPVGAAGACWRCDEIRVAPALSPPAADGAAPESDPPAGSLA